jgi:hypothetical protein
VAAPEDEDRAAADARLAAIVAAGRATRRPASRATWLAAAVVGALCAVGFVLLVLGDGEPAPESARVARGGCAGGLGVGLGLGIGIGFFLGRRQRDGHSSRSSP